MPDKAVAREVSRALLDGTAGIATWLDTGGPRRRGDLTRKRSSRSRSHSYCRALPVLLGRCRILRSGSACHRITRDACLRPLASDDEAQGAGDARRRRAISVPLTPVTRGLSRSLADTPHRRSGRSTDRIAQIPKLIVRVRFPSPAPDRRPRSGWQSRAWASAVQGRY